MEFQAVVMALGRGSRMSDLTAQCPKPLLPIGGIPMIWYPLHFLERSGFQEAIVLTGEVTKTKLKEMLLNEKLKLNLELNIIDIPDDDWGTAESLRFIHEKLKSDILVISCDLILDASIQQLVNLHRLHNASLTALFVSIPPELKAATAPGQKAKQSLEKDFIGMDANDSRLLFINSEADLDDTLTVRKSLLEKHPRMVVHSQLMDAHLYLFKRWVLDYLVKNRTLVTLKGEVIPHLIEKQFRQPKKNYDKDFPDPNASVVSLDIREDIFVHAKEDKTLKLVRELSSYNDHFGDLDECYHENMIRCYGCILNDVFCIRANTLASYYEANKQIFKKWSSIAPNVDRPKTDSQLIQRAENAQIDENSALGSSTVVGEKAVIKSSTLGVNCHVGERVRLSGCIIMNNVTVESGCSLEGTVVCDSATIGRDSKLKDCLVASGQKVQPQSKMSREVISDAAKMMEIL